MPLVPGSLCVYPFRVVLRGISPLIWRCLRLSTATNMAQLQQQQQEGGLTLTFPLQLVLTTEDGQQEVRQIASVARSDLRPEALGLTLAEAKTMLKNGYWGATEQRRRIRATKAQNWTKNTSFRFILG